MKKVIEQIFLKVDEAKINKIKSAYSYISLTEFENEDLITTFQNIPFGISTLKFLKSLMNAGLSVKISVSRYSIKYVESKDSVMVNNRVLISNDFEAVELSILYNLNSRYYDFDYSKKFEGYIEHVKPLTMFAPAIINIFFNYQIPNNKDRFDIPFDEKFTKSLIERINRFNEYDFFKRAACDHSCDTCIFGVNGIEDKVIVFEDKIIDISGIKEYIKYNIRRCRMLPQKLSDEFYTNDVYFHDTDYNYTISNNRNVIIDIETTWNNLKEMK